MRLTMNKRRPRWQRVAPVGALLCAVAACAEVKSFEYTEIHEIPPGAGLMSGEDGEFVLYGE